MNRQIQRLVGVLEGVRGDEPGWDDPVSDFDGAMDRFITLAQGLGPGGVDVAVADDGLRQVALVGGRG